MAETLFAKIIRKEIPADIVYEDEHAIAFNDIHPVAPVHILVIPKKPIVNVASATHEDQNVLGHLLLVANKVAQQAKLNDYRIVSNSGEGAGQSVFHLHFHIIGGRPLGWPPG